MSTSPARFADPILTANIYGSGLLDDILSQAIVPFWRDLKTASLDTRCYFWTVRYSTGGEHLKIRLHGEADDREIGKELLTARVESYLDTVRGLPPASPRIGRVHAPPIDPEDARAVFPDDRSLLWTTYKRSYVSLPGSPWLEDDGVAAHVCECLSRGCELNLAEIESAGPLAKSARQKLLIKALLPAMKALGFGGAEAAAGYLRYHRDWLLRFFIDETTKERQALERFGEQVARMESTVAQLRRMAHAHWASDQPSEDAGRWPAALAGLAGYTARFRGRDEYNVDPFANDVTFPPTFKVLHGLANQIGLPALEEAYVHHLILAAVAPASAETEAPAVAGDVRS